MEARIQQRLFKNIPECAELTTGDMYSAESCPAEVNTCMQDVHNKAQHCIMKEVKHWRKVPKANECHKKHKGLYSDWFKASCKWHLGIKKCLAGEETGPDFPHDGHADDHPHAYPHVKHYKAKECWGEVGRLSKECTKKASEKCTNYNACAGKGEEPTDERLKKWFHAAHILKHDKHDKSKEMIAKFKTCMGDELKKHAPGSV
jgi:hypothetical protein